MSSRPTALTGGCQCGAIRYSLNISKDEQWPTNQPPLSTSASYKEYDSSSNVYRSFCSSCGCSLTFNYKDKPEETDLYVGTLDEECLVGKKIPGSEKDTEHGVVTQREGGIGKECFESGVNFYCENAIHGITDLGPGHKFYKMDQDGTAFA
ncbi:MAG: hypothetical protein M1820_008172 [Bogoriella megaspora]|nr:MAG: hypothetical protein M1820_008172 [Bogoriella megaspora]